MRPPKTAMLAIGFFATIIPLRLANSQQSQLQHLIVRVAATNDEWTSTDVTVSRGDLIIVMAPGTIRVGGMLGDVDATGTKPGTTGTTGSGILQYKIGTSAGRPTGKMGTIMAEEGGALKLRVHDSRYEDNAGAFEVHLYVIPASAIPPPKRIP